MSEDALKALLQADAPAPPPARDIGFTIAVMQQVERRRFFESLAVWLSAGLVVTALLALVMPYVTPAFVALGGYLVPAIIILSVAGMVAVGAWYLRPVLRDFGIRV